MGHLIPGQKTTKVFTLVNPCQHSLSFSLIPKRYGKSEDGGRPVLVCRPSSGVLGPKDSCEVTVVFSPMIRGPAYIDEIEVLALGHPACTSIPIKVSSFSNSL